MIDKLNKLGIRTTPLHKDLYQAFHNTDMPLSACQLKKLITTSHNPSSLYRAINRFLASGLIKVAFVHEKEGAYYQLGSYHKHYIICRECGVQQALSTCSIAPMIKDAQKLGFINLEHKLEINGECQKCS